MKAQACRNCGELSQAELVGLLCRTCWRAFLSGCLTAVGAALAGWLGRLLW